MHPSFPSACTFTATAYLLDSAGVNASATYRGAALPSALAGDGLSALATTITAASLDRTRFDVGAPVHVSVLGRGAEGYRSTATVFPGLGAAPTNGSCTATLAPGGAVDLACALVVSYSATGLAQPSVNLTNGYATGGWSFPPVNVAATLALTVAPDPIAGYAGEPLAAIVGVANATGTAPFGPACLADGLGDLACATDAGPSWTFHPSYPSAGTFTATAYLLDSAGVNASRAVPVRIAAFPELGAIAPATVVPVPGASDALSAVLSGGLGPIAYWWNTTDPAGTFGQGVLAQPGAITAAFVGQVPGAATVTLTTVDALGTQAVASVRLYVEAGPAVALGSAAGGPNASWTAGRPTAFSWIAHAPGGDRVAAYRGPE